MRYKMRKQIGKIKDNKSNFWILQIPILEEFKGKKYEEFKWAFKNKNTFFLKTSLLFVTD